MFPFWSSKELMLELFVCEAVNLELIILSLHFELTKWANQGFGFKSLCRFAKVGAELRYCKKIMCVCIYVYALMTIFSL